MKPSNNELITRLKYARQRIVNGNEYFICFALELVDHDHIVTNWIADQLDPHVNYDKWLCENHPEFYKEHMFDCFRTGRLQWIDAMIQELQK